MEILSFEKFRLILEAEGDPNAPAGQPPTTPPADAGTPPQADTTAPTTPPPGPDIGMPAPNPFDQSALPADPNTPIQQGPPPFKLVFLDPDRPWHINYSEGGGVKRFTEYEISQDDFNKWITDSNLDSKKAEILDYISAKAPMPKDIYDKLKSQFIDKKIGVDKGEIDVEYDSKKSPSTNKLDVNFIKAK